MLKLDDVLFVTVVTFECFKFRKLTIVKIAQSRPTE